MDSISKFPFSNLPTELACRILRYSAQATFDQTDRYQVKSPYSSARTLCLVSKDVRRIVLPELLHTILLPKSENLNRFVDALRMQEEYAEIQKQNDLRLERGEEQIPNDLYFQYAPHIHKIWIGCIHDKIVPNPSLQSDYTSARKLTISVLTPVLLAAPSIALGSTSLKLFSECLEHAWKSRADTDASDEHSPPPWKTQALTLSGETVANGPWELLTNTPQGSAFLSSISHLAYGSHTTTFDYSFFAAMSYGRSRDYDLPLWMKSILWPSFKNLQTFSMAYPHIKPPFDLYDFYQFREGRKGRSFHVELLTLSAAMLTRGRDDARNWRISAFAEIGPGEECIRTEEVRLNVSHFPIEFWYDSDDWEKIWACGLCG